MNAPRWLAQETGTERVLFRHASGMLWVERDPKRIAHYRNGGGDGLTEVVTGIKHHEVAYAASRNDGADLDATFVDLFTGAWRVE